MAFCPTRVRGVSLLYSLMAAPVTVGAVLIAISAPQPVRAADQADLAAARPAFQGAAVLILGRTLDDTDLGFFVAQLANPKYGMDGSVTAANVGLTDATRLMKAFIAHTDNEPYRIELIQRAFRNVYGRLANVQERAGYELQVMAGKTWYMPIFLKEKERLKANPALRDDVIVAVYRHALGRDARPDELAYWQGRDEHYAPMIEASSSYLYSSPGATDWRETATRALKAKSKSASPFNLARLRQVSAPRRLLYDGMLTIISPPLFSQ